MITTGNNYLALGCTDGAVRFYDFFLRLESWFEDICGGGITSLSFSVESNPYDEKETGAPGLKFWVPNFTIGTVDALVVGKEMNPNRQYETHQCNTVKKSQCHCITSMSCISSIAICISSC